MTALKATFSEVCSSLNAELIEFSGETDYVHLLVSAPPCLSISRLVAHAEKRIFSTYSQTILESNQEKTMGKSLLDTKLFVSIPLETGLLQTLLRDTSKISVVRADAWCCYPSPRLRMGNSAAFR